MREIIDLRDYFQKEILENRKRRYEESLHHLLDDEVLNDNYKNIIYLILPKLKN